MGGAFSKINSADKSFSLHQNNCIRTGDFFIGDDGGKLGNLNGDFIIARKAYKGIVKSQLLLRSLPILIFMPRPALYEDSSTGKKTD